MNGRIYDAKLGRFLQADPIVQAPKNSQNLNRYSYVINNPLSYTDPSGFSFNRIWDKVLRPILAIAVVIVGNIIAPQFFTLWGALSGYISTGNLRGALVGAFSAAVFQGIGTAFSKAAQSAKYVSNTAQSMLKAAKVAAHGIAGGVMSELQGGKFGHGFAAAGFTQAFAGPIGNIDAGNLGFSAQRTMAAAVVGGTGSVLSGGKFANGAVTGAFSRAFNDEAQHGGLSKIFENPKFRQRLASALAANNRQVQSDDNGNRELGVAIYPDGKGGFNTGKYPNTYPSSSVPDGLRQGGRGSFGDLEPIQGASALAISLPEFARDNAIVGQTSRWQELSKFVEAPVVVTSPRAGVYVFDGLNDPVLYRFPGRN